VRWLVDLNRRSIVFTYSHSRIQNRIAYADQELAGIAAKFKIYARFDCGVGGTCLKRDEKGWEKGDKSINLHNSKVPLTFPPNHNRLCFSTSPLLCFRRAFQTDVLFLINQDYLFPLDCGVFLDYQPKASLGEHNNAS
jgi:hypothetical protein